MATKKKESVHKSCALIVSSFTYSICFSSKKIFSYYNFTANFQFDCNSLEIF